jgi:DNA-binding CsgD family transcriptional regulator
MRYEARRRVLLGLVVAQLAVSLLLVTEFLTYYFVGYDKVTWSIVELFEIAEAAFVLISIAAGLAMIAILTRRNAQVEAQLKAASGAMEELMEQRFREWQLSPSETEIARFTIKGLSITEIARLRGTSEGTIKAQNNAVYRKAGVNGRAQLLGLFVEELIGGPLVIEDAGPEDRTGDASATPGAQAMDAAVNGVPAKAPAARTKAAV